MSKNAYDLSAELTPPNITESELVNQMAGDIDANVVRAIDTTYDTEMSKSNPGSLERTFLKSLKSMFNQSSGIEAAGAALIASAFGGAEAGAAAFGVGQKLGQERISNIQKGAQLEIQDEALQQRASSGSRSSSQVSRADDLQDTRTGETLFSNKQGQIVNQKGQVVDPKYQKNIRAVREGRLQGQGDERIDISKDNLDLNKNKFYDKIDEDKTAKMQKVIKEYTSSDVVKMGEKALTQGQAARLAIENNSTMAPRAVATALARMSGEVGALSETDINAWKGSQALKERFKRFVKTAATGTMTEFDRQEAIQMLDVYQEVWSTKLESKKEEIASRNAKTTKDFTKDEAKDILSGVPKEAAKPKEMTSEMIKVRNKKTGVVGSIPKANLNKALGSGLFERIK